MLLSIAGFLPIFRLFVASSFTIRAKNLFSAALLMQKAGDRCINSLRLNQSGKNRTRMNGQGWFRPTI